MTEEQKKKPEESKPKGIYISQRVILWASIIAAGIVGVVGGFAGGFIVARHSNPTGIQRSSSDDMTNQLPGGFNGSPSFGRPGSGVDQPDDDSDSIDGDSDDTMTDDTTTES